MRIVSGCSRRSSDGGGLPSPIQMFPLASNVRTIRELLIVESIETRRPFLATGKRFRLSHHVVGEHLATKIALVEPSSEHRFVNFLKIRQGELSGQETERDRCILNLVAES